MTPQGSEALLNQPRHTCPVCSCVDVLSLSSHPSQFWGNEFLEIKQHGGHPTHFLLQGRSATIPPCIPCPLALHLTSWPLASRWFYVLENMAVGQVVMKCQERGWEKKRKTQCELLWFPGLESQKDRSPLISGWVGLSPWKGAVVPGRSDQICTSF